MRTVYKHSFDPSEKIVEAFLSKMSKNKDTADLDDDGNPTPYAYKQSSGYTLPPEVRKKYKVKDTPISDMYLLEGKKPGRSIFYIHGGGYWDQPLPFHFLFLRKLVDRVGGRIYLPVYPKSPTYGIKDAHAYINEAYEAVKGEEVVLMGDSAGGGFALSFALSLRQRGEEVPPLILLSPWLDLSCEKKDDEKDTDPWLDRKGLARMGEIFAGDIGVHSPLASPYFGDISGIEKLTIFTGGNDILCQDSLLLEEKYPHVELHYFEGAFHDFTIFPVGVAASKSFRLVCEKINSI
ncbi:MAG: alpha/beta hydrolase [Bacillota bacterium]|nr:alpha/beta hydrolase [Bacillota bacterium]